MHTQDADKIKQQQRRFRTYLAYIVNCQGALSLSYICCKGSILRSIEKDAITNTSISPSSPRFLHIVYQYKNERRSNEAIPHRLMQSLTRNRSWYYDMKDKSNRAIKVDTSTKRFCCADNPNLTPEKLVDYMFVFNARLTAMENIGMYPFCMEEIGH